MPSLIISEIDYVLSKFPNREIKFSTFVETGTHHGITINNMESKFDSLHTIEIGEPLYNENVNKYKGDKITFHLGDTSKVLKGFVHTLDNTIFFLDAHWSACDTFMGNEEVPLYTELKTIMEKFRGEAIIIIDDYRLFNKKGHQYNWEGITLSSTLKIVMERLYDYHIMASEICAEDRLVINLKKLSVKPKRTYELKRNEIGQTLSRYNLNINGVLHIGASDCQEQEQYLKYVNNDSILWVEAIPYIVQRVKESNSQINIIQGVISDKDDEEISFNVANNGGQSSSILELAQHATVFPGINFIDKIKLKTTTLKKLYRDNNIDPKKYNLLVMDIQGAEMLALKGAEDLLENFDYIYTEINMVELYKNCCLEKELSDYLSRHSFYEVETFLENSTYGNRLYVKNKHKWKIFITYHDDLYEDFYYNDPLFETFKDNFVFVKVGNLRMKQLTDKNLRVLDLKTLKNHRDMGKEYAESETLYNLYLNGKDEYSDLDYIGFLQYDHNFSSDGKMISNIIAALSRNIDFISFMPYPTNVLLHGQQFFYKTGEEFFFKPIIDNYNKYSSSNIDIKYLSNKEINVSSAFMVKVDLFDKMMDFISKVIESGEMDNKYHKNDRIPGQFLERYYGVYLLLNSKKNVNLPLYHFCGSSSESSVNFNKFRKLTR